LATAIVVVLSINSAIGDSFSLVVAGDDEGHGPLVGTNFRGYNTSVAQQRDSSPLYPADYYDKSFKLISEGGMDHIRYVYYWESYVKDPEAFISELKTVAETADRWGLKVLYDNHQFQTSSWLNPISGTGFPETLFVHDDRYPYGGGGQHSYTSAKDWWTDWWDRKVKDSRGNEGWVLMAEFLERVVNTVDKHPSTLGYEILNEPQIHSTDQWEKIGKFHTFMADELRKTTQKKIFFTHSIPFIITGVPLEAKPEYIVKLAPENITNVIMKASVYGMPKEERYQNEKLFRLSEAAKTIGIPLYIGEWGNVKRVPTLNEEGYQYHKISPEASDITQEEANTLVKTFREMGVYGMAYWKWDFKEHGTKNFNLIDIEEGVIKPTKYYEIVNNAYKLQ
jgi:hypothetical protein